MTREYSPAGMSNNISFHIPVKGSETRLNCFVICELVSDTSSMAVAAVMYTIFRQLSTITSCAGDISRDITGFSKDSRLDATDAMARPSLSAEMTHKLYLLFCRMLIQS